MPSQTSNSRSTGATSTTTRTTINKRQARAARRAYERRRRIRIFQIVVTIAVVAGIVTLFASHNPFANNGKSSVHTTTVSSCPAPTATPVGPVPALKPPQSPPAVTGTTVDGSQGLKYIDVKVGCGTALKSGDNACVIYSGWLQSTGKLFDSTYLHGTTPFPVENVGQASVISGWNLGLIGMKTGGTRRLIIPPALGYGTQGQAPIPGNATLIFDVTIASINTSTTCQ